jgi:hypothetical protein
MSVNIFSVFWVGDFRGRDFCEEDVWQLYRSVDKHIKIPFTFYTLTNRMNANLPGERIELKYNLPGWWSKVELFRPDLPKHRTLYLDLDSHVIRGLQPIIEFKGDLVMFNTRVPNWKVRKEPGLVCRYQAATMLFDPASPVMNLVWKRFQENPKKWMMNFRSEQDMYGAWIPNQPTFPDNWMIKLDNCWGMKQPPDNAIIVTGQPKRDSFRNPIWTPWLEDMARNKEKEIV